MDLEVYANTIRNLIIQENDLENKLADSFQWNTALWLCSINK